MKIAFLNDVIYDYAVQSERATWATGGAERQQWLLARALAAAGWTVSIGVRTPGLAPFQATEIDGVRFVGLGGGHVLRAWFDFFRAERPDWWFWQCASHLFGFGVALAALSGVRSVFGVGLDRDVRVREALYHRRRWWPVYAFGLSQARCIALQHEGQRADLPKRWRAKAYVVPNIAVGHATALPHARRPPVVVWIAALRQVKRPDRLVEIARLVPHVRFVVCGGPSTYMTPEGYSGRAIEAFRTVPNLDYRGQVSPDEALKISSESAILLSTSDEEGFPQTFLEAWSHGTPVVTLGIDPGGVIADGHLGAVCRTVADAAETIASLVAAPDMRDRLSANCRDYVHRAHSPAAAVAALEDALRGSSARPSVESSFEHVAPQSK